MTTPFSPSRAPIVGFPLILALVLSTLSATLAPWGATSARSYLPQPSLTRASLSSRFPGTVLVEGHGFTPGGLVHLIVYDSWGEDAYQDIWTGASVRVYGPQGSIDPDQGFIEGGAVRERFSFIVQGTSGVHLGEDISTYPGTDFSRREGTRLMVRAYDARSQTWSNVLDANLP